MWDETHQYMMAVGIKTYEDFLEKCSYISSKNTENVWSFDDGSIEGRQGYIMLNLLGNIKFVDKIFQDIRDFKHTMPFQLRDYQDYLEFRKAIVRKYRLKSMKVRDFKDLTHYNSEKELDNMIMNYF
jgi:hypothetical protein